MESNRQINAALTIQKRYRGQRVRKKFITSELKQLTNGDAFILGNDPHITEKDLENYKAKQGATAFVGTSCIRSIMLASKLGIKEKINSGQTEQKTSTITVPIPKLFIVDNAKNVSTFWKAFKAFALEHNSQELFLSRLQPFLNKLIPNILDVRNNPLANRIRLSAVSPTIMNIIFNGYSFDYIRAIILNTRVIAQTWEDENTFRKLRNLFNYLEVKNVYAYCSNISFETGVNGDKVLQCAHILKPRLTIHTDYNPIDDAPQTFYLCADSTPETVKKIITAHNEWPSASVHDSDKSKEIKASIDDAPQTFYLCADSTPETVKKIIAAHNEWPSASVHDSDKSNEIKASHVQQSAPISDGKKAAALTIQKIYRGQRVRKKFVTSALKQLTNGDAFIIGNGSLDEKKLKKYKAKQGTVAFVGTSCIRSVILAIILGIKEKKQANETKEEAQDTATAIPKLFIVDNSKNVVLFWKLFKEFTLKYNTQDLFLKQFENFVLNISFKLMDRTRTPIENIISLSEITVTVTRSFINDYGFDYVRSIILNTRVIAQTWEDESTFQKLRNIFDYLQIDNVYAYCANISFIPGVNSEKVLECAHILKPKMTIHLDLDQDLGYPTNFYTCDDSTPEKVKKIITAHNPWPDHDDPVMTSVPASKQPSEVKASHFQPPAQINDEKKAVVIIQNEPSTQTNAKIPVVNQPIDKFIQMANTTITETPPLVAPTTQKLNEIKPHVNEDLHLGYATNLAEAQNELIQAKNLFSQHILPTQTSSVSSTVQPIATNPFVELGTAVIKLTNEPINFNNIDRVNYHTQLLMALMKQDNNRLQQLQNGYFYSKAGNLVTHHESSQLKQIPLEELQAPSTNNWTWKQIICLSIFSISLVALTLAAIKAGVILTALQWMANTVAEQNVWSGVTNVLAVTTTISALPLIWGAGSYCYGKLFENERKKVAARPMPDAFAPTLSTRST